MLNEYLQLMYSLPGSSIFISHRDQCDMKKVTWEDRLTGFCLVGGQRARAKAFGDWWKGLGFGFIVNQVSHLSKRRTRTASSRVLGWTGAREEVGAGERAPRIVGKKRIEKPLSSVMYLHPWNLFSLRNKSSGLMDPHLCKDHIYGNIMVIFYERGVGRARGEAQK